MNKKYRNIVVNHIKYQWLYKKDYVVNEVILFKFDTEYDLYSNDKIEKRRYLKTFDITSDIQVKPSIVRHLILNGKIDDRFIRKLKLNKIDKI